MLSHYITRARRKPYFRGCDIFFAFYFSLFTIFSYLCQLIQIIQLLKNNMGSSKFFTLHSSLFTLAVVLMLACAQRSYAQLPVVTVKTMDGKTVCVDTLSNGGKPFIIDFFATWCKPCNRELDAISEVYADWQEETGVKIYAVSIDQAQNIHKVKPLVDNHNWEYDVLLDPNGDLKRALGIQMIPYVLIVDGTGKIVYRHSGYTDGEEAELIDKIREIIKK